MAARPSAVHAVWGIAFVMLAAGCAGASAGASTASTGSTPTFVAAAIHAKQFSVQPSHLRVGRTVTFSGGGCPRHDVVLTGVGVSSTTSGTSALVTPSRNGSWSATVAVGNSTPLGTSSAVAMCERAATHAIVFSYPSVSVTVTTFRRIDVSPGTSVTAGTKLTVVPNDGCPNANGGAFAAIIDAGTYPGQGDGIGPGAARFVRTDRRGDWSAARITVPPGTAAGHYEVTAYCLESRSYSAWYPVVPLTVTG